jgi:hypothetical protein
MKVERAGRLIRDASIVLCLALFLFLLVESGFSLFFLTKGYLANGFFAPVIEPRIKADTYQGASWVRGYYDEFNRSSENQWMSYVYWRRKPFNGTFINIDSDGIRLTPQASGTKPRADQSTTLFMFGGSALWGTGARDAFTIPAILGTELGTRGVSTNIRNFGESGYVSTQEVIALILELQKGNIPDIAIFYDGPNDVFAAYQLRVVGVPQNELNRVREFNLSAPGRFWSRSALYLEATASGLSTTRFLRALLSRFGDPSEPRANPRLVHNPSTDAASLARDAVVAYWKTVDLVAALGEQYNFKCLFYWQPTIFGKEYLTEYERSERRKAQYLETFYKEAAEALQQTVPSQKSYFFEDLSSVFADTREPQYVDWVHTGESGNHIIAQRMAKQVLAAIGESR